MLRRSQGRSAQPLRRRARDGLAEGGNGAASTWIGLTNEREWPAENLTPMRSDRNAASGNDSGAGSRTAPGHFLARMGTAGAGQVTAVAKKAFAAATKAATRLSNSGGAESDRDGRGSGGGGGRSRKRKTRDQASSSALFVVKRGCMRPAALQCRDAFSTLT